jgi:hypothetical protein
MKRSKHKSTQAWERVFGKVLLAKDPLELSLSLQDAKNAIMDHIEDTMRTASQSERRLLGTALEIVRAMQRSKATSAQAPTMRAHDSAA